ncbi:ion transporter [Candidatus Puniceispirillum marinum]|uniref:Kef-type K+ transport systems, predicted NAD-binding component n=1 Tax=Puniceispirillum marinum (strain IMCC1322) TaxID=488538 RepID=D5BS04_PUNMI|nr:ion transporter [Candidatus Puniceispirillum marinum]ADE39051.1 Kef-type K+ transport systems, predicted NAD-binding component [Candidatus Puniceispirillum marinum IMCC1322]
MSGLSKKRVLEILSRSNGDDKVSMYCDRALSTLILLNLLAVSLESIDHLSIQYGYLFWAFELFSVTIFGCEYILRIWSSDANIDREGGTPAKLRFGYIFSFTGLIDLIAILPSILPLILGQIDLRWLRVLRLVRLLKISHYSTALEDLISAIREERNAFGAALYLFCIALFVSSALMYVVEHEVQPENFSSIPTTMWWSMITLTTVGYGDVSPMTSLGKLVGAATAIMGICVVALLTGIVATAFANQVARRKDIFEAEILHALADGVISEEELERIKKMQTELNLSDEHVRALIELLSERGTTKPD